MRRTFCLAAAWGAIAFGASAATATETIEVEAQSGRVLRGVVDTRTDDARLWVRREEGGVVLTGSMAWSDVARAVLAEELIDLETLRRRASETASTGPRWFAEVEVPPRPAPSVWGAETTNSRNVRRVHVRSVEIVEACLVNLDRDVEPDAMRVSIAAIGDDRSPVVIRGSLSARLVGQLRPATAPDTAFGELDRWSQPVAPADFVDGVATYELRFRRVAPEWQFDLMPDAVLELQLGADGEGNYAASAPVVLRELNPLRDQRQLARGTRFSPGELHGRDPASAPRRINGRWFPWTW